MIKFSGNLGITIADEHFTASSSFIAKTSVPSLSIYPHSFICKLRRDCFENLTKVIRKFQKNFKKLEMILR